MENISQTDTVRPVEDETVKVGVLLPKSLDRAVEMKMASLDCTKSQFFADALRERLASLESPQE
ncbi:MAG: hypothetical protein L0Z53_25445 [Acidobacteriales bacterium]|nr:hypothetical protein [Terriglobales bacterium]